MFIEYYDKIDSSNFSTQDKTMLKRFLELLDKYRYERNKLVDFTHDELGHIFEITKVNPRLQIEIWRGLPDNVVNNVENLGIFEDVLENKFGEYINGIDKKALVNLLNTSRYANRSSG